MTSGQHQPHEPGSDPLDALIRQALQRNTPSVQPPKRIWERIQGQVTAGPAPTSHRPPAERLSRLFAPFVQGIAATAVLILVGMSLISNRGGETRPLKSIGPLPTPVVTGASAYLVRPEFVGRQDRLTIVDDALDYTSGRDSVQKDAPQVERSPRLRMVDGPDIDLIPDSYYALVVNRP
jgi:hypothetical protein